MMLQQQQQLLGKRKARDEEKTTKQNFKRPRVDIDSSFMNGTSDFDLFLQKSFGHLFTTSESAENDTNKFSLCSSPTSDFFTFDQVKPTREFASTLVTFVPTTQETKFVAPKPKPKPNFNIQKFILFYNQQQYLLRFVVNELKITTTTASLNFPGQETFVSLKERFFVVCDIDFFIRQRKNSSLRKLLRELGINPTYLHLPTPSGKRKHVLLDEENLKRYLLAVTIQHQSLVSTQERIQYLLDSVFPTSSSLL
jgi:hypothetical protein